MEEIEKKKKKKKRCWYSGKSHSANPSLAGKVEEKASLVAQQAVTCACALQSRL